MKTITSNWNGTELREIVQYNNKLYRIVTGLYNGGSQDNVEVWTEIGWKYLIGKHDIGIPTNIKDTSYVSSEISRKNYAEVLNKHFQSNIKKLF